MSTKITSDFDCVFLCALTGYSAVPHWGKKSHFHIELRVSCHPAEFSRYIYLSEKIFRNILKSVSINQIGRAEEGSIACTSTSWKLIWFTSNTTKCFLLNLSLSDLALTTYSFHFIPDISLSFSEILVCSDLNRRHENWFRLNVDCWARKFMPVRNPVGIRGLLLLHKSWIRVQNMNGLIKCVKRPSLG